MKYLYSVSLMLAGALLLSPEVGNASNEQAASASVKTLSAPEVDSYVASLKGKVVLVNFWATWCPPCRAELPAFVSLQGKYESQGLRVVGFSLDERPLAEVAAFAQKNKINYSIFVVNDAVTKSWGNFEAIPMTFLIDAKGKRIWQHEGIVNQDEVESQIKALLPK